MAPPLGRQYSIISRDEVEDTRLEAKAKDTKKSEAKAFKVISEKFIADDDVTYMMTSSCIMMSSLILCVYY